MALISCPECGKEKSEQAKVCPHCGYKEKNSKIIKSKNKIIVAVVAIALLICAFFTVDYISHSTERTYSKAIELLEVGNYAEAYNLVKNSNEELLKELKTEIKYETMALNCVQSLSNVLKNPESLQIKEVTFFDDILYEKPPCWMHISAQNGFGGTSTSYCLFKHNDITGEYEYQGNVKTYPEVTVGMTNDEIQIVAEVIVMERRPIGTVDISRLNQMVKKGVYRDMDIIW